MYKPECIVINFCPPISPIRGTRSPWYTAFVRNVTITLDDETARWARVEAAKQDTSVSKFVGAMLRERMHREDAYERAKRSYRSRGTFAMSDPGDRYPTRDEIYERR